MKRIIGIVLLVFVLCACEITRDRYYVFYFDDYNIAVGYDDVEYMRLVFEDELIDKIKKSEEVKDIDVYFWDKYFASIDVKNYSKRNIDSNKAVVTRLDFYIDNEPDRVYKIDDVVLSSSVKENCDTFKGKYFSNNGYGCVFGKRINNQDNVVILYGDYLNEDQDKLHRIEIYVK